MSCFREKDEKATAPRAEICSNAMSDNPYYLRNLCIIYDREAMDLNNLIDGTVWWISTKPQTGSLTGRSDASCQPRRQGEARASETDDQRQRTTVTQPLPSRHRLTRNMRAGQHLDADQPWPKSSGPKLPPAEIYIDFQPSGNEHCAWRGRSRSREVGKA